MKAVVSHTYNDGAELISVNGHSIQYGHGAGGDGYCYAHGSFECLSNLSSEEQAAVDTAVRPGEPVESVRSSNGS